jgi:hypothetical protein
MRFKRRAGSIRADLDAVEADVLIAVAGDLLLLLGEQEQADADPLAALVGLTDGPTERPDDPALARLLPDAYSDDDPEAATEFRRYTEQDLRAGKRAHASTVLATLAPLAGRGGRLVLDRDEADAWLGCLNDLRLVLGTRLEVTDETELDPHRDDPRAQALQVYGWLGWLQESLLGCIAPRPPR